jgi:hypothetical protein
MRRPDWTFIRGVRGTAIALVIAAVAVVPSLASTTVTQTITDGTRTADLSSLTFDPLSYSNAEQLSSGTMSLTADDSTGTGAGWNVTIQSSDFVYSGSYAGTNIPAAYVSIVTPGAPTLVAGEAVSTEHGPFAGIGGSLDTPRKVLYADEGGGKGTYSQELPIILTIPGGSLAGSYTSTFTVTMTAGPGS